MIQEILAIVGFVTVITITSACIYYILKAIKDAFEDYWYDRMHIQMRKHDTILQQQNDGLRDTVRELQNKLRHTRAELAAYKIKVEEEN